MKNFSKLRASFQRFKKNKPEPEELLALEASLQKTLTPVDPRPQFIKSLQNRLQHAAASHPLPVETFSSAKKRESVLLGTASVLSVSILILSGVRTTATFLGAVGILYQANRYFREKKAASTIRVS